MESAPLGSASVTTPDTPQKPTGEFWTKLEETNSIDELRELEAVVRRHGYSESGQLRTAIADKMSGLRQGEK